MRSISNARRQLVALAVLALTAGVGSGEAGGLVLSEAQALPLHGVGPDGNAGGAEIIGYDCTGRAITRFDTPPTWCPPIAPIAPVAVEA
jgi:hypothetical protein